LRKKRQIFRRELAKTAENCDNNIEPWDQRYDLKVWAKNDVFA
jgi:hypothetical protein